MHIRTRLLVLLLSILVPSLLASVLAVWFVYDEQADAQKKGVTEATRALALLVDSELETTQGILRTLANSPALAQEDFEVFYKYARTIAPPTYSAVVLTDLTGKQIVNTRLPFGAELPKGGSNLTLLRQQFDARQTIVSDLFFAPAGKRYDFALQVPVLRDNQVRYYLSMGMAATQLQPLLSRMSLPPGWIGVIVDRNGVVVARTEDADRFVGKQANEALLKKIVARQGSGIHYGTTLDGTKTAGFFHRAPFSNWTIIINVPLTEMRRPALYAATILSATIVLLMAMALAVARVYTRKTTQTIDQLRDAAERLGRGETVSVAPTGLVETDTVHNAMATASMQLQQNRADLERRIAEAVAASERAQRALLQGQKLEALGRLTAGIAHDFNNILQTLSTSLHLIRISADQSRVNGLVDICNRAIERATVLTGQMRSFGRVQDASMGTVFLDEKIETVLPLLKNALPSNIALDIEVDQALWPVTVDPLQLELALLNLVINARDAMPHGGKISLRAKNDVLTKALNSLLPGEYVRITIADDGTGMSAEVMSKALDPFFTTKSVDKGTGLGLPQAYGFATQAQGTLVLHSIEGKGTFVTIYIPRALTEVEKSEGKERLVETTSASGALLFVEDDPLVREAVAPALGQAGFNVIVAKDGEEALSILESGRAINLVFSDIVMPGNFSGIDLARVIEERFPSIRVVLATGYTEVRAAIPGVRLLAKPYNVNEAVKVLSQAA